MGTELVSDIVWRVRQLVHDAAGARWEDAEMLKWANDGLREIVLFKPSANATRETLSLSPGTVQELPDDCAQLVRITHNTSGAAVRLVDMDRLDASAPAWRTAAETSAVEHYMYDDDSPQEFQVYPPNDGNGSLEAVVAKHPTKIQFMADTFPLSDIYVPAMVDYLLYRAYSKHSKFAGNENRAAAAYQRFAQALGVKRMNETQGDPNVTNKNETQGVE